MHSCCWLLNQLTLRASCWYLAAFLVSATALSTKPTDWSMLLSILSIMPPWRCEQQNMSRKRQEQRCAVCLWCWYRKGSFYWLLVNVSIVCVCVYLVFHQHGNINKHVMKFFDAAFQPHDVFVTSLNLIQGLLVDLGLCDLCVEKKNSNNNILIWYKHESKQQKANHNWICIFTHPPHHFPDMDFSLFMLYVIVLSPWLLS